MPAQLAVATIRGLQSQDASFGVDVIGAVP